MGPDRRTGMARWLLLLAITFGVLVMHHVPAGGESALPGPGTPTAHTAHFATAEHHPLGAAPVDQTREPHGAHGLIHECLAVLAHATLALLAVALLLRLVRAAPLLTVPVPSPAARGPNRAPSGGGRAILTSCCVLRV